MCQSSSESKNQTAKEVYEFKAKSGKSDAEGIGLFLVPAPEIGIMEYKIVAVEGLTYKETTKRGQMCEAFKFFPIGVTLYADKEKTQAVIVNSLSDLKDLYCDLQGNCSGFSCEGACICLTFSRICIAWQ